MVSRSAVALAIVQEVIRLHPPVMVQFRLTTKDLVIDDMAVPEGTLIVLCPKKVRGLLAFECSDCEALESLRHLPVQNSAGQPL